LDLRLAVAIRLPRGSGIRSINLPTLAIGCLSASSGYLSVARWPRFPLIRESFMSLISDSPHVASLKRLSGVRSSFFNSSPVKVLNIITNEFYLSRGYFNEKHGLISHGSAQNMVSLNFEAYNFFIIFLLEIPFFK
jgi:hypothetical protein